MLGYSTYKTFNIWMLLDANWKKLANWSFITVIFPICIYQHQIIDQYDSQGPTNLMINILMKMTCCMGTLNFLCGSCFGYFHNDFKYLCLPGCSCCVLGILAICSYPITSMSLFCFLLCNLTSKLSIFVVCLKVNILAFFLYFCLQKIVVL